MNIDGAYILGFLDLVAAYVMLWCNQRITTTAGLHTPQARWALFRRMIYCVMAVSLFCLGVERLFGNYKADNIESLAQSMLLIGIMIFPFLRAVGLITQDSFMQNGDSRH